MERVKDFGLGNTEISTKVILLCQTADSLLTYVCITFYYMYHFLCKPTNFLIIKDLVDIIE